MSDKPMYKSLEELRDKLFFVYSEKSYSPTIVELNRVIRSLRDHEQGYKQIPFESKFA